MARKKCAGFGKSFPALKSTSSIRSPFQMRRWRRWQRKAFWCGRGEWSLGKAKRYKKRTFIRMLVFYGRNGKRSCFPPENRKIAPDREKSDSAPGCLDDSKGGNKPSVFFYARKLYPQSWQKYIFLRLENHRLDCQTCPLPAALCTIAIHQS